MLTDNTGYLKLAGVVKHILATGNASSVLEDWYGRRWSQVEADLRGLCNNPGTDAFVDEYADALAGDLCYLLQVQAETVKERAPINAAEILLAQARLHAESQAGEPVPDTRLDPVLPDILEPVVDHHLACAA